MTKKAVAISHVCFEDAGTLADALGARGVELTYLQAGVDDLAHARDADILIVLGGPIGVYEVDRYPFLRDEFAAVERAMARGKPSWEAWWMTLALAERPDSMLAPPWALPRNSSS